MELKIGDVVQLKSSGPQMVVDVIAGEDIKCRWYDRDSRKYESETFNVNQLNLIDNNKSSVSFGSPRRNW